MTTNEKDQQDMHTARRQLHKEWGADYETNIQIITKFLEKKFEGNAFDEFVARRQKDGTLMVNNPQVLKHYLKLAKKERSNPVKKRPVLPELDEPPRKDTPWIVVDAKKQVMRCDRCKRTKPLHSINGKVVEEAVNIMDGFTRLHSICKHNNVYGAHRLADYVKKRNINHAQNKWKK